MNELELLASLRDEIPLTVSDRVESAVLAEIAASRQHPTDDRRRHRAVQRVHRPASLQRRRPVSQPGRRLALRPVIAGALAIAAGAGAYSGVELSGSAGSRGPQTMAWSGRPTAPWPNARHPSYGRATSEAQLIDYVTRAADAMPGRAPNPGEWVAVRVEHAGSSGGEGGYLFGLPDKRQIELTWIRGDECGSASVPPVPATTAPATTVTGTLTVMATGYFGPGCQGTTLGGWKSVTYSYLDSLPTDPAALEDVLAQGAGPDFAGSRAQAIFQAIDVLLDAGEMDGVVVPPKLTAALYRVLEQLPGVQFESATDLAGRQGLGFSMVLEGYYKLELVINPDTYTFMGFKDVAIRDHAMVGTDGTRYVTAGHVLGWAALLDQAIVQAPGQLPG